MNEKRKSTAAGLPPLPPRNLYASVVAPVAPFDLNAALESERTRNNAQRSAKAARRANAAKALNEAALSGKGKGKGKRGRPAKAK